jgi:hypothetical protein
MTFAARNIGLTAGQVTVPPSYTYSTAKTTAAVTSTVTYNSDGTVVGTTTGTSTLTDTTHPWFVPQQGGVGTGYFLRITPTVGSLTSNGASAFTAMSSALAITRAAGSGQVQSCTFTVDIATDAGGTNIVGTQSGNVITADGT